MNKITVKNLIVFGKKNPSSTQTLINNLKKPKVTNPDNGGSDYWISALSCLVKSF